MLQLAHVVEDLTPANGGITTALGELIELMQEEGVASTIFSTGSAGEEKGLAGARENTVLASLANRSWRWAPTLRKKLRNGVSLSTVVHIHGIWMYPQWAAARECLSGKHPFVLTPHNMLGGWLGRRGFLRRMKKAAYWRSFAYPAFRHATVVHALTEVERDTLREGFFHSQRIDVIPNPIDVYATDHRAAGQIVDAVRPYFLFLGRLHPVKGLEILIDAFSRLSEPLELWIAGPTSDVAYEAALRERVARSKSPSKIRFLGAVAGEEKWRLLRAAWSLCAPSYSEGLSMSALEALACSTPVITTPAAGIGNVECGGGILVDPTSDAIEEALRRAASWTQEDRRRRGADARKVALETYAPAVVGPKYLSMYRSLGN